MCYVTAHDKQKPTYVDDVNSGGGREIIENETTASLQALVVTLNFIDCWIKHFHHIYEVRSEMYNKAMKNLYKQIPSIKSKPLSQD